MGMADDRMGMGVGVECGGTLRSGGKTWSGNGWISGFSKTGLEARSESRCGFVHLISQ